MILYMFQCHSPKSSHPLFLPESKRLFYTSVSLLLSRIQGYCYHLSKFHIHVLRWHPTPVLLPGKSHGWRSLVGCSPWGREELDMTERLHLDRKSTRLNSSHHSISYAVFCLKKKKKT